VGAKTAHPVAHPHRVARWIEGAYTALMAVPSWCAHVGRSHLSPRDSGKKRPNDVDIACKTGATLGGRPAIANGT